MSGSIYSTAYQFQKAHLTLYVTNGRMSKNSEENLHSNKAVQECLYSVAEGSCRFKISILNLSLDDYWLAW